MGGFVGCKAWTLIKVLHYYDFSDILVFAGTSECDAPSGLVSYSVLQLRILRVVVRCEVLIVLVGEWLRPMTSEDSPPRSYS
jgi:hypothetical protein